jgi:hypothetical protein
MNWQGWFFMCLAWGFISIIFFYSFYRILFDEGVQPKRKRVPGEKVNDHHKSKVHKKT